MPDKLFLDSSTLSFIANARSSPLIHLIFWKKTTSVKINAKLVKKVSFKILISSSSLLCCS